MKHTITETRVSSLFIKDELTEAVMNVITQPNINEGVPASPDDAIRDMFTSKMFKGTMSNKDVSVIFKKGGQWDKLFGIQKVMDAWKELVDDEYIIKKGSNWSWAG